MKEKLTLSLLMIFIATILLTNFASAIEVSVVVTNPANSEIVNGTYTFTATTNTTVYNCTFYIGSTQVGFNNTAGGATSFTYQNSTTQFSDSSGTYTANATCGIALDTNSSNSTTFYIDNTIPSITLLSIMPSVNYLAPFPATCQATDTVDSSLTYNQTILNPSGTKVYSTSSATYTFTSNYLNEKGTWTSNCTVSDDSGWVQSKAQTFRVVSSSSGEEQAIEEEQEITTTNNNLLFILFGAVIFVVVVIAILMTQSAKKKHRRRK